MTALSSCLVNLPGANIMAKFIEVWEDTFINVDKIIRISKTEGKPHPNTANHYQHEVLGSDREYHWTGCYESPTQWVIYTSDSWDGIYRITDPQYFNGVEDLLK